jgi:uncharacterized protein (TIGR02996 family)
MTTPNKPAAALPDARPFLRAICADPSDDAPRLIYADWLEEHDYSDQAEYIRTALAIPQLSGDEREAGEDRAWDLLRVGRADWQWPLDASEALRVSVCDFTRGFPAAVGLAETVFLAHAATVFGLHPLTAVDFNGMNQPWRTSDVLVGAGLTLRGESWRRVPGPLFPFLASVGAPCVIQGREARFAWPVLVTTVVSRAAVAYGRSVAGLPPPSWRPLTRSEDDAGEQPPPR